MRYTLLALCLLAAVASATSTVKGEWQVNLLRSGTTVSPASTGATQQQAWANCLARIPAPAVQTTQTTGSVKYTCQTPRYVAIVTYGPNPVPVDCIVSAWSPCTGGTWSACSGDIQSRTGTRTRTVTTQPANGGTACPLLSEACTVSQPCTVAVGTASLSWTPPTRNTDGTSLTNLAGYRISYGTSATAMTQTIQLASPSASSYVIEGLTPGTYYFAVRAYTSAGTQSALSSVASKTIQ